ncbi:MAG TPA: hypothetical protein VJI66_03170 [Candidatus Paceibacterota bacterium]
MDTKFQTSFIPKKPLLADQTPRKHRGGMSVFMFVSVMIFIFSIAGSVYSVFWKKVLLTSQDNYRVELKKAEERFNSSLIEELRRVNTKLDLTKSLLKNHLAVSEVFSIISGLTIEGVRFTSFDFSEPADSGVIKVSMRGVGNSFSAIAFQSDVFGQSEKYGTNKVVKNPVLSDLVLDQKGDVTFTFIASIEPSTISYEKTLVESTTQSNE